MDERLLLIIAIIVVVWLSRRSSRKRAQRHLVERALRNNVVTVEVTTRGRSSSRSNPRIRRNFHDPVPSGWEIAESAVSVAGISYRKAAARMFVRGFDQSIRLEVEPNNPVQRDALKVIGIYATREGGAKKETHIGYVPSDVAELVRDTGLTNRVRAQLENIYEGDNGFVGIRFNLLCLKEDLPRYESA